MVNKVKVKLRTYFKWFTLIELIIVIAIIAVLWVSAFLILTQWMSKSRDAKRISDVNVLKKTLEIWSIKNEASIYPMPDWEITIKTTQWAIAWNQWYWWENVRNLIWDSTLTKIPVDPSTKTYYWYSVTNDRSKYQILARLDWKETFSMNLDNAYAQDTANFIVDEKVASLEWNFDWALVTSTWWIYFIWNVPSIFMSSWSTLEVWTSVYVVKEWMSLNKAIELTEQEKADISILFSPEPENCDAACKTNIENQQKAVFTKIQSMFSLEPTGVNDFLKTVPWVSWVIPTNTVVTPPTENPWDTTPPPPTNTNCVFWTSKIGECILSNG